MSDPAETGRAIGDHWGLLVALGGILVALGAIIGGVLKVLTLGDGLLDKKVNAALLVSLDNGLGTKISALVENGVTKALASHIMVCPQRSILDEHNDRLLEVEHALLRQSRDDDTQP